MILITQYCSSCRKEQKHEKEEQVLICSVCGKVNNLAPVLSREALSILSKFIK